MSLLLVAVGVVLLVQPYTFREYLGRALFRPIIVVIWRLAWVVMINLDDVVGWGLIAAGLIVLVMQFRLRTRSREVCPRCGGRLRRVPRRLWERLLFGILMPELSRFGCAECGWSGLLRRL